jgi:eukaryotic-like serine/threonine-protein kinase
MLRLKILFQCLGQALCTQGARSLNGIVPFGDVIYQVAMDTVQRLREIRRDAEVRDSLEWAASAGHDEIREQVDAVVTEVGKAHPPRLCKAMTAYLTHFPPLLRQALKRPSDPSGRTVPQSIVLEAPEDLLPFLPPRVPRFRAGDSPREPLKSWQFVGLLGLSSFGETWKARHTDDPTRPPAVLKLCTDIEAPGLLFREAIAMQVAQERGSLAGVVPLTGCFRDIDPPVCRYDFVNGGDLTGLVRDGLPGPSEKRTAQSTRIMRRVAKVVGSLHRLDPPIVHRGLKPRNILLEETGPGRFGVRVLDLGVAALASSRLNMLNKLGQVPQAEVLAASLRGSFMPLYASPQQMRGEPTDVRDDVHALGVIWYQLMLADLEATPTGRDWLTVLRKAGAPEGHIRLLTSCVNPRLERRPPDALALADEIGALLSNSEN